MTVKASAADTGRDPTDQRREDMLVAAAALIAERGFSETRIADVARRAGASPALVIYYFGTKDQLLTEALRYSDDIFYAACTKMLAATPGVRDRLEKLVRMTCEPDRDEPFRVAGASGSTCGPRRSGTRQVAKDRAEFERRWRRTIAEVVREGVAAGEIADVDADDFAITWGVLLDGLSIQVALQGPESVDFDHALELAMSFAERELGIASA